MTQPTETTRHEQATKRRATLIGFAAILMWAFLALLTAASGTVPPMQMNALCFAIGGAVGLVFWWRGGRDPAAFRQPLRVWSLGLGGLFGYHFLFFSALRNAPPVEASLICYLWPLLIVLFSALLPGERLGWHHIAGAVFGLAGAALIVTGGDGLSLGAEHWRGYAFALVAAFFWSGYSVLSRLFAQAPTETVTGFCLASAALSALCHLGLEQTVWPQGAAQWLAVLLLGLGPVGGAFFLWDYGVKRGDIQVLGAGSYIAPLLSTVLLIGFGFGEPSWNVLLACLLITGGAALAAKDLILAQS